MSLGVDAHFIRVSNTQTHMHILGRWVSHVYWVAYFCTALYELAYCFFYCGKVIVDLNGHCNCNENDAQAALNVRPSSCVLSRSVCSPLSNAVSSVLDKCYVSPKSPQYKKKKKCWLNDKPHVWREPLDIFIVISKQHSIS